MQPIREKILKSLAPVVENPKHVFINEKKLVAFANELKDEPTPPWNNTLQLLATPEQTLHYYFFVDSINFCFWQIKAKPRWEYKVDGKWMSGYYAYAYAIKQAFENDPNLYDAEYCADLPFTTFIDIFDGRNELLLMEERYAIIKENFRILLEGFDGKVTKLLEEAKGDVNKLVDLLIKHFPSFRDIHMTKKKKEVYFLKRAQLFCSDISFALPEYKSAHFKNLGDLTAFADYKVPQILREHGVLEYNLSLSSRVAGERIIEKDSDYELEIRAQNIIALEALAAELKNLGRECTAQEIDWLLWVKAKEHPIKTPYHKTITTFY